MDFYERLRENVIKHHNYYSGFEKYSISKLRHHHELNSPTSDPVSSKETFELLIAVVVSLSACLRGYIATLGCILLLDDQFISSMNLISAMQSHFILKFAILYYLGEMMGSLVSYVVSDYFGRKSALILVGSLGLMVICWAAFMVDSADDALTARFFLGVVIGLLVAIAPVYAAEVS